MRNLLKIRAVSSLDSRLRKHNGFMTKLEVELSLGRGLEIVSGLDIQVDRSIIIYFGRPEIPNRVQNPVRTPDWRRMKHSVYSFNVNEKVKTKTLPRSTEE